MKKALLLFILAVAATVSCTKKTTNIYLIPHAPYTVNGIHDLTITNGDMTSASLTLTVEYYDSSQEKVTLAVTGLPSGITMNNNWVTTGIPTFSTDLLFFDTSTGVAPGSYPITVTATSASYARKTYTFNLNVVNQVACNTNIEATYLHCTTCAVGTSYIDGVTFDGTITNKIWISNFQNMGIKLYAWYECASGNFYFPYQTVGTVTYHGSGHYAGNVSGYMNYGTTSCYFNMQP